MPADIRYQNPFLPSQGLPGDLNVPLASWRYLGQLGSAFTAPFKDVDGVLRTKTFMLVKTNAVLASPTVDGAVAWWSNGDTFEVTTDPTALGRGAVAGVFLGVVSVSSVVAIQVLGRHPGVRFIGAPTAAPTAARLVVTPSATAGSADCLAAGTAPAYPQLGLSVGAVAANFAAVQLTIGLPY